MSVLETYANICHVAPFAGAWIEILIGTSDKISNIVAPFAGAWIEILLKTIPPV